MAFAMIVCVRADQSELVPKLHRYTEPQLGTVIQLLLYSDNKEQTGALAVQCFDRVKELDSILSDYKKDSELNQLCSKEIGVAHEVSNDLFAVLAVAQKVSEQSAGAFDVTVGSSSKQWRESKTNFAERDVCYTDLVLDAKRQKVTFKKALSLDLGGIGKGYIADQLMALIQATGVQSAAVSIGGETLLADAPPGKKGWKVGIENPEKQIVGALMIENAAISTSGDSYQFFELDGKRHAHLIDPKLNRSKQNRLNVVTIAPSATQADAWATALRILPTQKAHALAEQQNELEVLFLPLQGEVTRTKQFPKLHNK